MTTDQLYSLLPALYRLRDAAQSRAQFDTDTDGPLRALLGLLAEQVSLLEEDMAQLYDDQFIETCAEWVVPYIGDLVGVQDLTIFPGADFSQRGEVANALRNRRRKGTASMLEQVARDVTGWDASVVEFFQHLATTQYLNHLRPDNQAVASVRNPARLERVNTPFDSLAHTADMRRIEPGRGRYNIPNIGIFLWPIQSFPITNAPAYRVADFQYCFDALGRDLPLYNRVLVDDEITRLAGPDNVPMPFTRLSLTENVQRVRLNQIPRPSISHYGQSLTISVDGNPVSLADIQVCDLSGWANLPANHYAIDPVLGRIGLPASQSVPNQVHVSYHYGFSSAIGGGEYERASTFFTETPPPIVVTVTLTSATVLQDAINALPATGGIIEIQDNETYLETLAIEVPTGHTIELRAANHYRPMLALNGALTIVGGANSQFILNGLLVSGGYLQVPEEISAGQPNELAQLHLRHCTLLPGASPAIQTPTGNAVSPQVIVAAQPQQPRLVVAAAGCAITVEQSIMGSMRVTDDAVVTLTNSIVDATGPTEIAYAGLISAGPSTDFDPDRPGANLTVRCCTIIGKVHCRQLTEASNTIFEAQTAAVGDQWPGPVWASQRQQGCVRFSYIPPGSRLHAPHRCQPATAADAIRVRPVFTSLRYGDAGYGRLNQRCAIEIRQGADDGAEMGVFHDLFQPQRIANLRTRLTEYLRFGLEAGIFSGE